MNGGGDLIRSARTELGTLLFFLLCWVVFVGHALAGYPLAGYLRLNLYHLYGLAAAGGWLLGNVEVHRSRLFARGRPDWLTATGRRRLFWLNLLAPGGVFYLLWSLGPEVVRRDFPMVPVYALAVFAVFFLVPVSLQRIFNSKQ